MNSVRLLSVSYSLGIIRQEVPRQHPCKGEHIHALRASGQNHLCDRRNRRAGGVDIVDQEHAASVHKAASSFWHAKCSAHIVRPLACAKPHLAAREANTLHGLGLERLAAKMRERTRQLRRLVEPAQEEATPMERD